MTAAKRLDATRALFLDLHHPTASLPPWASLTTGVPAALAEPKTASSIARLVARHQGAEAGLVERSSLHALIDVFTHGIGPEDRVAVDECAYPTMQWAAALARARGARVLHYRHHQPDRLPDGSGRLVVATDGLCSGCGQPAPLAELAKAARRTGGLLVVDDSLACGVLGRCGKQGGFGDGTGTVRWLGVRHDGVVWLASFAKAYGSPVTVMTGPRLALDPIEQSGNRMHSSPPSAPELLALQTALASERDLSCRRRRLAVIVRQLRAALADDGFPVNGIPFPVVAIPMPTVVALRYWATLRSCGIDAIVQQPRCRSGSLLSFVLRASNTPADIDRLATAIRRVRRGGAAA